MGDTIKVRVAFTVPISRSAWERTFGVRGLRSVAQDVRVYIENGTLDQLQAVGVLGKEGDE